MHTKFTLVLALLETLDAAFRALKCTTSYDNISIEQIKNYHSLRMDVRQLITGMQVSIEHHEFHKRPRDEHLNGLNQAILDINSMTEAHLVGAGLWNRLSNMFQPRAPWYESTDIPDMISKLELGSMIECINLILKCKHTINSMSF